MVTSCATIATVRSRALLMAIALLMASGCSSSGADEDEQGAAEAESAPATESESTEDGDEAAATTATSGVPTTEAVETTTTTTSTTTTSTTTTNTTSTTTSTTTTTLPPPPEFSGTVGAFEDTMELQQAFLDETLLPRVVDDGLDVIVSASGTTEWVAVSPAAPAETVSFVATYNEGFSTPAQLLAGLGAQLYDLDPAVVEAFNTDALDALSSIGEGVTTIPVGDYYDLAIVVDFDDVGEPRGLLYLHLPQGADVPANTDALIAAGRAWAEAAVPTIEAGIRLVPGEVTPGVYRTVVPGSFCLVRRLSDVTNPDDSTIQQEAWGSGEQGIIFVQETDVAFENDSDCGRWELVDLFGDVQPLRPDDPFPDGTLLVGVDVQPGTYRMTVTEGFCLVQRLAGFTGADGELIQQEAWGEGEQGFIEIAPTDLAFRNDPDCGEWEAV